MNLRSHQGMSGHHYENAAECPAYGRGASPKITILDLYLKRNKKVFQPGLCNVKRLR
jgi:hypothetical protein